MSQKHYVAHGEHQGETAVVTREVDQDNVMVKLIDFHTGKPVSDEEIPMKRAYLQNM